jgi:hypothetical protein
VEFQFGNAAEWAAAIGTVGTLIGTLTVIRRDHERQADAERWDQALLVDGSVVPVLSRHFPDDDGRPAGAIGASITNNGRRPIESVTMTVIGPHHEILARRTLGDIPARAMSRFDIPPSDGIWGAEGVNATWQIVFSDAGGWVWTLSSDRQLEPTKPALGRFRPFRGRRPRSPKRAPSVEPPPGVVTE